MRVGGGEEKTGRPGRAAPQGEAARARCLLSLAPCAAPSLPFSARPAHLVHGHHLAGVVVPVGLRAQDLDLCESGMGGGRGKRVRRCRRPTQTAAEGGESRSPWRARSASDGGAPASPGRQAGQLGSRRSARGRDSTHSPCARRRSAAVDPPLTDKNEKRGGRHRRRRFISRPLSMPRPNSPSTPAWGQPGAWQRRAPRPRRGRPGARLGLWVRKGGGGEGGRG